MNNSQTITLDSIDKSIINTFQHGFPLLRRPYLHIAEKFSISEQEVIRRLKLLQRNKIISRIGAIITPNTIGVSTLCAIAVPVDKLEQTAHLINAYPEVNHNYKRSHKFNLWFVLTAQNESHLEHTIANITEDIGMKIINLPMLTAYYLNLGFSID